MNGGHIPHARAHFRKMFTPWQRSIAGMDSAPIGEIAFVHVGDILAQCGSCANTVFSRIHASSSADMTYICLNCGTSASRRELIDRIVDEAERRARLASTMLEKHRRMRRLN
jgi:predicted RNA-binding Zn-ribbon protein involved in translation (DUF1610 family)